MLCGRSTMRQYSYCDGRNVKMGGRSGGDDGKSSRKYDM